MDGLSESALRRGALGVFAAIVGLDAAYVGFSQGLDSQPQFVYSMALGVEEVVIALAVGSVGLWLALARPRNLIGWLILVAGGSLVAGDALQAYGARGAGFPDSGLPAAYLAISFGAPLWIPAIFIPSTLLLARYPTGALAPGRWPRLFDRAALVGLVMLCLGYAMALESVRDVVRHGTPPIYPPKAVSEGLMLAGAVVGVAGLGGIAVGAIRRAIDGSRPERMALLWLLVTSTSAVLLLMVGPQEWMGTVAYVGVLVAIAVGVLRYRALGIEVVVRRALTYAVLTGLVLLAFVVVTAAITRLVPSGPMPQVVSAILVAVGLAPARERVQAAIDRLLYGERADPWATLARFGGPMGLGPDEQLPAIAAALGQSLRVHGVGIRASDGVAEGQWGEVTDAATVVSLVFGGDAVGELRVGPRSGEAALGRADRRLLAAVAPLVAAILHSARLTGDLRAEQQRVIDATRAERTRLQQDLHDGLGPSLTGIGLGLDAARSATAGADPQLTSLLTRLRVETTASLEEVRRIIDDLRPAALDGPSLVDALRGRARQVSAAAGIEIEVDVPSDLPDLPTAVEVAAFRIVDEALTNVVRHAAAHHCLVQVWWDDRLHLAVDDDGVGVAGGRDGGVGLVSMRQRAERLGGHFAIERLALGTAVRVELPMSAP